MTASSLYAHYTPNWESFGTPTSYPSALPMWLVYCMSDMCPFILSDFYFLCFKSTKFAAHFVLNYMSNIMVVLYVQQC